MELHLYGRCVPTCRHTKDVGCLSAHRTPHQASPLVSDWFVALMRASMNLFLGFRHSRVQSAVTCDLLPITWHIISDISVMCSHGSLLFAGQWNAFRGLEHIMFCPYVFYRNWFCSCFFFAFWAVVLQICWCSSISDWQSGVSKWGPGACNSTRSTWEFLHRT